MFKSNKNNKQTKPAKGGGGAAFMQQMGFQIPNYDDPNFGADGGDDDDDESLEAELMAMQRSAGGPASKRPKANQKKPAGKTQDLQSFHTDVNKLLSDIDRPINDDDLSDVDDDELLAELSEITGDIEDENEDEHTETKPVQSASSGSIVPLLEARLAMYKKAVDAAKTAGEASKLKRMDRQFKHIQELLQTARAGRPIDVSEIPPEIGAPTAAAPPSSQPPNVPQPVPIQTSSPSPPQQSKTSLPTNDRPVVSEPPAPVSTSNNPNDDAIAQLKKLALEARRAGDDAKAKQYLIQMKNLQSGATPISAPLPPAPSLPATAQTEVHDNVPENEDSAPVSLPLKAPEPTTIMEALQQRHEELVKRHQEAVSKGENPKARRMDRLKTQYQEAIVATRKGQPYDYSELADLPGFAPIPFQPKPQTLPPSTGNVAAAPVNPPQPTVQMRQPQPQQQRPMPSNGSVPQPAAKPSNTQKDQQIQALRLKYDQLKKNALEARQKNDLDAAKKYIIEYKEVEKMIASAESSLPVETREVLEPPNSNYDMVLDNELTTELAQSSRETIYHRLQEDLLKQMQLCARNQQMYAQMEGTNNIKQANEYKLLEQRCARDLERLRQAFQHGIKAPVFHYEIRQLNIVQVNNDLTENDCEVTVIRGINLQVPTGGYTSAGLETYVFIEFPYPTEAFQTARTRFTMGSINAEYPDSLHKFQIKRNDKFKRLMLRKELKLSIYHKAGFLRADRLLGVAFVKLDGLDHAATIHESVNVYENDHKKKAEGKLEVKIRIKEALGQTKSSESSTQKWLVIDRFDDIPANGKPSTTKSTTTAPSITAISRLIPSGEALGLLAINLAGNRNNNEIIDSSRPSNPESHNNSPRNSQQPAGPQSIQVLKFEADLIQEQIDQLEDHLTADQIELLRTKQKTLKEQSAQIVENIRKGGKQALEEHVHGLEQLLERFNREEAERREKNDLKKADLCLTKKKLVAMEIETLTDTSPPVESNQF